MVLRQVLAVGYLTHFGWGCAVGEHCAWAIIEAENEAEALMMVPAFIRRKARAIQLKWYSREDLESKHKKGKLA